VTYVTLSDGEIIHVVMSPRSRKPTLEDIKEIEALRDAVRRMPRCRACKRPNTIVEGACEICGWEREENFEEDDP